MVGMAAAITRVKKIGPLAPPVLVAVTLTVLVAATFGVPVSAPLELQEAQDGKLPQVQIIGVSPVAVNW